MSINIPKAYRLKSTANIWKYIRRAKVEAEDHIQQRLLQLYKAWAANPNSRMAIRRSLNISMDQQPQPAHFGLYLLSLYRAAKDDPKYGSFILDTEFDVFKHGKRYYIIPRANGILSDVLDFMMNDADLQEFHFIEGQKPNYITSKDWNARGKEWAAIMKDGDRENFLTCPIMNLERFQDIDPSLKPRRRPEPQPQPAQEAPEVVEPEDREDVVEEHYEANEELQEEPKKELSTPSSQAKDEFVDEINHEQQALMDVLSAHP